MQTCANKVTAILTFLGKLYAPLPKTWVLRAPKHGTDNAQSTDWMTSSLVYHHHHPVSVP